MMRGNESWLARNVLSPSPIQAAAAVVAQVMADRFTVWNEITGVATTAA